MFFHEILIYNLTSFDLRVTFTENNNITGGFSRPHHIKLNIKKVSKRDKLYWNHYRKENR